MRSIVAKTCVAITGIAGLLFIWNGHQKAPLMNYPAIPTAQRASQSPLSIPQPDATLETYAQVLDRLEQVNLRLDAIEEKLTGLETNNTQPFIQPPRIASALLESEPEVIDESREESWFWNSTDSDSFSLGAISVPLQSLECRGKWCRLELPRQNSIQRGSIEELQLIEGFRESAGEDIRVVQSRRPDSSVYFISRAKP